MRHQQLIANLGVILALGTGAALSAEQRGTVTLELPPLSGISNALRFTAPWRPDGSAGTRIVGSVIDIQQTPVAKVKVRLRNITTGEIAAETESDDKGEYFFPELEPGMYVVEMFIDNRYIVALSNAGSVARFETLQTVIQLPGRWDGASQTVVPERNAANFLGISAATTLTAATLTTAVTERIPTSDQGVVTSPQ
jgi:Carboxypeptidase regulatory-like domain